MDGFVENFWAYFPQLQLFVRENKIFFTALCLIVLALAVSFLWNYYIVRLHVVDCYMNHENEFVIQDKSGNTFFLTKVRSQLFSFIFKYHIYDNQPVNSRLGLYVSPLYKISTCILALSLYRYCYRHYRTF